MNVFVLIGRIFVLFLIFSGNELRRTKSLSLEKPPPEDSWLPSATMIGMTSGTDPVTEVRVTSTTINNVTVAWTPPVVYGSNRLQGIVVR